jgi:hypothetical protein
MRWTREDAWSTATRLFGLLALAALVMALVTGSAAAAGNKKLIEGTVYDTTCAAVACGVECPPPPHCGPITAQSEEQIMCPMGERMIACPLSRASAIACVRAEGCPGTTTYPLYAGEGGVVKVRKRGSTAVLTTVRIIEGRFRIKLVPGYYAIRPFLPEPECWSGAKLTVWVDPAHPGPVPSTLRVANSCVAHPDVK